MKKNPKVLIAAGLAALVIGFALNAMSGPPKADAAMAEQCQTKLRAQKMDASFIKQCEQKAFALTMTATDAQSAALAISAANNEEVGGGMLAKFLIGLGLALAIGGVVLQVKEKKGLA